METTFTFNFLGVRTRNNEEQIAFIRKELGVEPSKTKHDWAYYSIGNFTVELFARKTTEAYRTNVHPIVSRSKEGKAVDPEGNEWIFVVQGGEGILGVQLDAHNPEKLQDYYKNTLGMKSIVLGDFVKVEDVLESQSLLYLKKSESIFSGESTIFFSIKTNDIDGAIAHLREKGITFTREKTSHSWGGTDVLFQDSEGNKVQVVEYRTHQV